MVVSNYGNILMLLVLFPLKWQVVVSRCLSADDADDVPQVCAVARRHAARRPRSRTVPTEREVEWSIELFTLCRGKVTVQNPAGAQRAWSDPRSDEQADRHWLERGMSKQLCGDFTWCLVPEEILVLLMQNEFSVHRFKGPCTDARE